MKIKYGKNKNNTLGPGIEINLNGVEIATAINNYLVSRKIEIYGARTIRINGQSIQSGKVFIDPTGAIICKNKNGDMEYFSGRGKNANNT